MLFDDVFNTAQEVPLSALSAFILQIHKFPGEIKPE